MMRITLQRQRVTVTGKCVCNGNDPLHAAEEADDAEGAHDADRVATATCNGYGKMCNCHGKMCDGNDPLHAAEEADDAEGAMTRIALQRQRVTVTVKCVTVTVKCVTVMRPTSCGRRGGRRGRRA